MKIGYLMQEGVEIRRAPFNGPAHHVREAISALRARGHQVRVLVRLDGRIWRSDDLEEFHPVASAWLDRGPLRLVERGVRRLQWELKLPYAAMFESVRFADVCRRELRGWDVLYERLGWVAYGGALAARSLNTPLVFEDNGDAMLDLEAKQIAPKGLQRRLSVALMRRAVGQADHVVSTGAGWREQFIRRWKCDPAKVTAIENGTRLVGRLGREALRSFRPCEGGCSPVTLVYLGGFYPWHGAPVLLSALADARGEGAAVRLLMIGAGDGLREAQQIVARFGLEDAVTLTGHLEPAEYAGRLADADIGVAPYCGWPEFSGLKVLDYKAAGLPTIVSGVNGHPRTIEDGWTGLVVPPCDSRALTRAIVRLSADREMRRRMGQAARVEAEVLHGWEQTAERLEGVLLGVVAGGRR